MTNEQKLKIQIGKKENVIRYNSDNEVFNVLGISIEEYNSLSDNDKLDRLIAVINENSWKGQRKTLDQKEKEKKEIDLNNTLEILKDILVNGTKEEKDILLGVIRDHKKVLEIKELEKELAKQEKDIEAKKAKLKELKGE
jgi:hypothetical protein